MKTTLSPTVLEQLSRFTSDLQFQELPADVISKANDCFFDLIGCVFGALQISSNQVLARTMLSANPAQEVPMWGIGNISGAAEAALALGYLGYDLEYDDGIPTAGHWGSSSIPAAYFSNLLHDGNGESLITAIVAAYEVGTRISRFFSPELLKKHVHFPCTMGAFAAITGYCKAAGFSSAQLTAALSLAGLFPQGTYSTALSGGSGKSLYSGWPNFLGVHAARFALMGLSGDFDILESPDGFGASLGVPPVTQADIPKLCGGLGEHYCIKDTYFKPYPCCRWLHAPIAAACELAKKASFSIADIKEVRIYAPSFALMYNTHIGYESKVTCQYSFPYSVAAALTFGSLTLKAYEPETRKNPQILSLAQKINVIPSAALDALFAQYYLIRLEVLLKDGRSLSTEHGQPWGADIPPSKEELIKKFSMLTEDILPIAVKDAFISCYLKGFHMQEAYKEAIALLAKPLI